MIYAKDLKLEDRGFFAGTKKIKDRTFVIRLSSVDPEEIIRRGKIDFSTSKAALRYARVILEKYNGQRGGGKLQPRLLG